MLMFAKQIEKWTNRHNTQIFYVDWEDGRSTTSVGVHEMMVVMTVVVDDSTVLIAVTEAVSLAEVTGVVVVALVASARQED